MTWPTLVVHLVSSTLILAFTMIAARVLPLTARTRHAVLLLGLASFAIPGALVVEPLRLVGFDLEAPPVAAAFVTIMGGDTGSAPHAANPFPATRVVVGIWLIVAFLLIASWSLWHRRAVAGALRGATAPTQREVAALSTARQRTALMRSVDLIRSSVCEAPVVLRVVRPVIVLPGHGCGDLDESELISLLCHECAHVVRRDNLLGRLESLMVALLWFHPLVWWAQREIAAAREEACDEIVADATTGTDTYLSALAKICRAAITAPLSGVSCMANAHLKQRLEHLMNYNNLKRSALSHGLSMGLAATLILAMTTATGLATKSVFASTDPRPPYSLQLTAAKKGDGKTWILMLTVRTPDNEIVFNPGISVRAGERTEVSRTINGVEFKAKALLAADGSSTVDFSAIRDGAILQQTKINAPANPEPAKAATYSGERISLTLKDKDVRDVFNTFGAVTGLNFVIDPEVSGKVSINAVEMPWDQALDILGKDAGLTFKVEKGTVHVTKTK
jgi:beta-lactamase regulating signal transducer with metallopeptidase domain